MRTTTTLACSIFFLLVNATHADELADARATDPIALQWMVGSPPPPEKLLRYQDGSFYAFPQRRWSLSHWREFVPTVAVPRGTTAVRALPRDERIDLDAVTFTPIGGTTPMTWADSLIANYTDGIVILHRGRIVYERYFGALSADRPHICFSVTKSFFGTLATMLIAEDKFDPKAPVTRYVPELASSGFGDATVQQVLDMTTAIDFTENYVGESPTMLAYRNATGFSPRPVGYQGPATIYSFLPTIAKNGDHGVAFKYRTPNVDVASWVIARVTGMNPAALLSERIWSRLGAEDDAFLQVDKNGVPLTGSTFNARLRDLARFGELMRLNGRVDGRQIIASSVVEDIRRGASPEAFAKAQYATLPGWSYHNFWWISHDDHGVFMARGIHGQAIYIDPKAEMVIARFASNPIAGNAGIDPKSLPAYRAIAEKLMGSKSRP
jgi:CubicO group peptidase (beta-lactamase class C family)